MRHALRRQAGQAGGPLHEPRQRRASDRSTSAILADQIYPQGGTGLDCALERRMDLDPELGAGLLLRDVDRPVDDVRSPHARNVAAALVGVEKQGISQPFTSTKR